MFKTVKEVISYIRDNDIEFVDFKMTDLRGRWKHLSIPAKRFNESIMTDGIGFDGSNYGYANVENSDMIFIPDITTAAIDPFVKAKTLTMIGDVQVISKPDNLPFDQYPRNVAKAAVEYLKSTGIADEMIIGPEYEFHIFDSVQRSINANEVSYKLNSTESYWSNAVENNNGFHNQYSSGYHADIPNDVNYDLRNEICRNMEQFGIDVKYHHHEVGGSGQLEIETELGEMVKLADDTLAAKYVIRNTAAANGKTATLMPKPIYGEAGNGMHIHMLLKKNGKNVFYEDGTYGDLSQTAMYFIGGILKHIKAICAFSNPTTNSYKRLLPGFEAPVVVGYAMANRSAVIRIPSYVKTEDKKRFELRNPDATCNPYYTCSAILMAGLDGVLNKIDPKDHNWGPFDFNLFDLSEEEKNKLDALPTNINEALSELEKDHEFLLKGNVFSESLISTWIKAVKKDADKVTSIPHPAEIDLYYDI